MPKKDILLAQFRQAESHLTLAQSHLERQRQIVAEAERDGHDATKARELLALFEESHARHVEERDRLVSELAEASRGPSEDNKAACGRMSKSTPDT